MKTWISHSFRNFMLYRITWKVVLNILKQWCFSTIFIKCVCNILRYNAMTQLKLRIKHNNNIRKFLQFALQFKCFLRYQLYDSKNCYMFYLNMQGDYGAVSCFFQRQRRYPHKIDEKIQRHTFLVVSFIAARDTSGFSRTMYLSKGPGSDALVGTSLCWSASFWIYPSH